VSSRRDVIDGTACSCYRGLLEEASEAKDEVMAEYEPCELALLVDDVDEALGDRAAWRLRVTQLWQRPRSLLQRPRQPRS